MKVVGISGSPRKDSFSTDILKNGLEIFQKNGWETIHFDIPKLNIKPCTACNYCHQNNECFLKDEVQGIIDKINRADALIVSSPVYFYSITGQLKVFIDRCQPIWAKRFNDYKPKPILKKRPSIFIATAGSKMNDNLFLSSKFIIKVFANTFGFAEPKNIFVVETDRQEKFDFSKNKIEQVVLDIINLNPADGI